MIDFFRRVFIAMLMAMCISLLFFSVKITVAQSTSASLHNSWTWPAEGVVTGQFGERNGKHYGIDIAAEVGTPVYSAGPGKVSRSYYSDSYGNVVFIAHTNGMETVYAHLNKRFVSEGENVKQGVQIGEVGNTGRSSGSHLHFEVHNGSWNINKTAAIDPMMVFDKPVEKAHIAKSETSAPASSSISSNETENVKKVQVTVAKGDTLWAISQKYGVSVDDIMKWNDLSSSLIKIGQALTIKEQMTKQ